MSILIVKMRLLYWLSYRQALLKWVLRRCGLLTIELRLMIDHVRKGDVVFDIGANRGYFTQLYSVLAGKAGRVFAFEPVPTTFRLLQERMAARQVIPNVELVNVALADTDGVAVMHLPAQDDGQASLRPHHGDGSWKADSPPATFECRQTTLDRFAGERKISRLDFLKCDVEGAELLVLRGAVETLRRFRPVIYLEVSPAWTTDFGYEPAAVIEFLRPLGYEQFLLVMADGSHPQLTGMEQLKNLIGSANLLCLSNRDGYASVPSSTGIGESRAV